MSEAYWSSWEGITTRLEMLGDDITSGTYNDAIQVEASSLGIRAFRMAGPYGARTCDWCAEHLDQVYRLGQFMPRLPKHPHCPHNWDLFIEIEPRGRA
jgi:hypothetical protein